MLIYLKERASTIFGQFQATKIVKSMYTIALHSINNWDLNLL